MQPAVSPEKFYRPTVKLSQQHEIIAFINEYQSRNRRIIKVIAKATDIKYYISRERVCFVLGFFNEDTE